MKNPQEKNDSQFTELVYGKTPVLEIIENANLQVNKIWISNCLKDRDFKARLVEYAKSEKIPCNDVPQEQINKLTDYKNNQGVALSISPVAYLTVSELLEELTDSGQQAVSESSVLSPSSCILIAHEIEDVHNVGAMVRTLTAAGCKGVILTGRSSVGINSGAIKASAGTIFQARIARATNCSQVIAKLKENGFWIVGTANEKDATNLYETDLPDKMAIIMGNEHEGLPSLVKKNCDLLVRTPISDNLDSLNVSVAFGIMLFEFLRQSKFN